MFLDSTDYDSVWSKVSQMTWNLLSNSQGSPNHDVIVNKMFSEKHETQKILVSFERLFDSGQLLTRNLGSILTSLGDTGC